MPAHKSIGHQIPSVINDGSFYRHFAQAIGYLADIISFDFVFELAAERQPLAAGVNVKYLFFAEIYKAPAFAAAAFTVNNNSFAH